MAAESAVTAAREQLLSNQTLTDGIAIEAHPSVLVAAVKVREAHVALGRAQLLAPVDGQVAKRRVQLGERVSAGEPLMAVIDLTSLWVEANFKENQLARLRIGQPVELIADVYGQRRGLAGRSRRRTGRGDRFGVLAAAGPECHRGTDWRWCNGCRCALPSMWPRWPSIRCGSACRCRPAST
ncbi:MAG: HlyD family efflux transporter periplasmic adaptor subunit [Burkholderiaceae bacterium]